MSLDNFESFFHLNVTFGVTAEAAGSSCVLSNIDADGLLNVCCGMSNSQYDDEFHDPEICFTETC